MGEWGGKPPTRDNDVRTSVVSNRTSARSPDVGPPESAHPWVASRKNTSSTGKVVTGRATQVDQPSAVRYAGTASLCPLQFRPAPSQPRMVISIVQMNPSNPNIYMPSKPPGKY